MATATLEPQTLDEPLVIAGRALRSRLLVGTGKYRDNEDLEGFKSDEEVQSLSYTGNLGPYTFENWKREDEFVATRNENYYMRDVDDAPEA